MSSRAALRLISNCWKLNDPRICTNIYSKSQAMSVFPMCYSRSLHCSHSMFGDNSFSVIVTMTDGTRHEIQAKKDETILDCIKNNSFLDIMGYGQCDGGASCSTCHVMFKQEDFERLQPKEDIESDLLELMGGQPGTSRLGCQVKLTPEMAGIEIYIPGFRKDIREEETNYSSV